MYEKIVNYFEQNLCIDNIYFRRYYLLWILGVLIIFILEAFCGYLFLKLISNQISRFLIMFLVDLIISGIGMYFVYLKPINKIYKEKVKVETKIDKMGFLMHEDNMSAYREIQLEIMSVFLKNECKIKNVETINIIEDILNEEIAKNSEKNVFVEKYFYNLILPLLILILTVYFTNTNQESLLNIVLITIGTFVICGMILNFFVRVKYINITPVNKRENLINLKRVLNDIKIEISRNKKMEK